MRLDVALMPALLRAPAESVCIVVDVLRASSACVTMFESGIEAVAVAPDPEAARQLREHLFPAALLCGEVDGLPPEGFDYGNSPLEFSRLDLRGRRAVLSTSNGTRALHAVAAAPAVLVGCLLNRAAVSRAALGLASRQALAVSVVCAGNNLGTAFSLDDCFAAGALVAQLAVDLHSDTTGPQPQLTDAAVMARRLYESYGGDALAAFREAGHGRALEGIGFAEDLRRCAELDRYAAVPQLQREQGQLILQRVAVREAQA